MHLETQTMAGAMTKRLEKAVALEHATSGAVYIGRQRARAHGREGCPVGLCDRAEQTAKVGVRYTNVQRPRKIDAVSVVDAPEVQHDTLAFPKDPRRGPGAGVQSGQVLDVRRVGHDKGVKVDRVHVGAQAPEAVQGTTLGLRSPDRTGTRDGASYPPPALTCRVLDVVLVRPMSSVTVSVTV